jgi:hypothetical protein
MSAASTPIVASPAESTLPAELRESMTDFLRESRAPNTRRAYRAALAGFARFCDQQDRSPLPACPRVGGRLPVRRGGPRAPPRDNRLHASAIAYSHRLAGHPNPCDTVLIRDLLRGIRRTQGVAPRQAPRAHPGSPHRGPGGSRPVLRPRSTRRSPADSRVRAGSASVRARRPRSPRSGGRRRRPSREDPKVQDRPGGAGRRPLRPAGARVARGLRGSRGSGLASRSRRGRLRASLPRR